MGVPGLCASFHVKVFLLTFVLDDDLMLMDTILACLKGAGRPTSVHTGSDMFARSNLKRLL